MSSQNNNSVNNVNNISSFLQVASSIFSGADQNSTTSPESSFYLLFQQYLNSASSASVTVPFASGNVTLNALDIEAALAGNSELTYTYSESYPTGTSSSVNLAMIAEYFNDHAATSGPPFTISFNDPEGQQILAWWNTLTGGSGPAITSLDLNGVVNYLVTQNYVAMTAQQAVEPLSNEERFNTWMQNFLEQYTASPNSTLDAQDFLNAFTSYFGNDATNLPSIIPIQFQSSSDPTKVFGFPSDYYFFTSPNQPYVGLAVPGAGTASTTQALPVGSYASLLNSLETSFFAQLIAATTDGFFDYNPSTWTQSEKDALFNQSLGTFLQYIAQNPSQASSTNFFEQWQNNSVAFAMMNYPTTGDNSSTILNKYKVIWDQFYPNDPGNFLPALVSYMQSFQLANQAFVAIGTVSNAQIVSNPDFDSNNLVGTVLNQYVTSRPSGALGQWFGLLRNKALGSYGNASSTEGGGFDQVQLLFDIYDLLLQLLNNLQSLTAQQLNRQVFYAHYQGAYTDLEVELTKKSITGAGGKLPGYGSANTANVQRRSDIQQLTSQYTESIKSFRSMVSDLSSQQNTAVNQSQEATSQQVNVAQTILQQFGTILQSIWR